MTTSANIPVPSSKQPQARQFALWANTYDDTPNPMLSLEQRILSLLLPDVRGRDVLDVGCGTGRWLDRMVSSSPASLTGVDPSPEMLEHAAGKLAGRARLLSGDACALPVSDASADVVLASFVASYVEDLARFTAELRRAVRSDGKVFLSDVHPETAAACGWKRGFVAGATHIELRTPATSLDKMLSCFAAAGLEVISLIEPPFGQPEANTLLSAGKLDILSATDNLPAIYILELRPAARQFCTTSANHAHDSGLAFRSARVALDEQAAIGTTLEIREGRIASLATSRRLPAPSYPRSTQSIDLTGYLLLPGLINAHDHLEFGLYPNLGRGPYANCQDWATDIHQNDSNLIAQHQTVPKDVRLWWGAIRNLLCGVTTVCHHNPLSQHLFDDDFPVRVISNFGWAHSLAIDPDFAGSFHATPPDVPFITHACEGLDDAAAREIFEFDRLGALDERSILVHGLALSPEGIALLNQRSSTLVWCPTSNCFLFGRTHTAETIAALHQVLLGSDSSLTAAGDLLDEVRFAHRDTGVPAGETYRMVSDRAALAFRLGDGQGTIRAGVAADFIAVRDRGLSPADTLASLTTQDVELVLVRGRVQLASHNVMQRLPGRLTSGLLPLAVDSTLRWIRAPLGRLFSEAQRVLGCDIKLGGKEVRHVSSAWL